MLRFIFNMLFYGAFLGVLTIVIMWFFFGMTVQQSISWLMNKVNQTQSVVADGVEDAGVAVKNASQNVSRQIERVAKEL